MTARMDVATPNRSKRLRVCTECGREYVGQGVRFCSIACRRPSSLTAVRAAIEAGDGTEIVAAVLANSRPAADCREWLGPKDRDGYPRVYVDKRARAVHRMVAEVQHGPLGGQPVHHLCANRACVRPEHLLPVTQAENNAEMLSRNFYEGRIAELEAALMDVAPNHPALTQGGVTRG